MSAAPPPPPDITPTPSGAQEGSAGLDRALEEAIHTMESPSYRHDNPAFDPLNARDAAVIAVAYVALPVLLALWEWLS